MNTYNQETLYVRRNAEGTITDVYESNPAKYYKVVDVALRINPSASDDVSKGGD